MAELTDDHVRSILHTALRGVEGLDRSTIRPAVDRWFGQRLSADEVIQIANETSDSQGNLYRLDFISRIKHEAGLTSDDAVPGSPS